MLSLLRFRRELGIFGKTDCSCGMVQFTNKSLALKQI